MAAQSSQPTLGRKTEGKKEKEKHVFAKKAEGKKGNVSCRLDGNKIHSLSSLCTVCLCERESQRVGDFTLIPCIHFIPRDKYMQTTVHISPQ